MEPKPDLQNPIFQAIGLPIARLIAGLLLTVLGPTRVRGRYRVPRKGGLLILSNHLADVDPVAIQWACPRAIYFMGKSELFDMPVVGPVIRWFRAFGVRRGQPDREALRLAAEYLHAGQTVMVFPEGQLSESGDLQDLKPGVSLIARMAAPVQVICVGLHHTNRIMPYGKVIPRPAWGWVTVTWGEPRTWDRSLKSEEFMAWVESQLRELSEP